MKVTKRYLPVIVAVVWNLVGLPAAAYDLWIVPGKFRLSPGERIRVFLNSGDEFPGSASLLGEYRISSFELIGRDGRNPLRGYVADGKSLTVEVSAPNEGTAILALAIKSRLVRLKADEFNVYLKEDGLPQILALREERAEMDQPAIERYTKWAKAILTVGNPSDETWKEPTGLGMEIVPEKNPQDLRPGEELPATVLFEGQPLSGLTVIGARAGGPQKEVEGVTDREGRVRLKLPEAGRWYLRTIHMVRLEDDSEVQWESFWTTLTFELNEEGASEEGQKPASRDEVVRFELQQPELFAEKGSLTNAWADFDNDGDLDLYVGFGGNPSRPNCLYRNDGGKFVDVAAEVGLADLEQTRAIGWGDYDGDGHLDLYVGFSGGSTSGPSFVGNRLYRNDGDGRHFSNVTKAVGVELPAGGLSRQISWIDYDNDGDVDLFVAFRDLPDKLFRNDGGEFTDVSKEMGIGASRASMGAVWFDYDEDGDLDMYLANMDGYRNCLYRNDGTRFVDVAEQMGVDSGGREIAENPELHKPGSIRPDLIDYDNDGDLDIYVTNLGTVDALYRYDGEGQFVNVSDKVGLANDGYRGTASWADYDNDGLLDVFVNGILYRNEGARFTDVTPAVIQENVGGYGVQSADFDGDGDLDLAFSNRNHYLFSNLLPAGHAPGSLQVMLLDAKGRYARAGSEIRLYAAGTRKLLGTRVVESGSGYCSQNVMPVHFGLGDADSVDVEITTLTRQGRKVTHLMNVEPRSHAGGFLVVKVGADGQVVK